MARNKYPEETVERILEVATRLFTEKGYEYTTVQDIIDNLGGLTKGAIYHHFKSKEEIMYAVAERLYKGQEEYFLRLAERRDLTGLDKIRQMVRLSLENQGQDQMMAAAPDMKKSPQIFMIMFHDMQENSMPLIQKMIEQGIEDGSIETKHPKQLSEVFLLLANIWMNPLVMRDSKEENVQKFIYFQSLMEHLGLPGLVDETMLEKLQNYGDMIDGLSKREK